MTDDRPAPPRASGGRHVGLVKAAEYGLFACGATIAAIALAVAALDLFGL